jgi:hypothetical protein
MFEELVFNNLFNAVVSLVMAVLEEPQILPLQFVRD